MQRSTSRNRLFTRARALRTSPPEPRITSLNSLLCSRVSSSLTRSSSSRLSRSSMSRSLISSRHSAPILSWSAMSRSTSPRNILTISECAIRQRYSLFTLKDSKNLVNNKILSLKHLAIRTPPTPPRAMLSERRGRNPRRR